MKNYKIRYSKPVSLRNFSRTIAATLVAGLIAGSTVASRPQDATGPVRERLNLVGSDLFSPTPHPAEAIKELKAILAIAPDSAEAHMLLGIAYRAQGTPELMGEAVAELRQAIALNPELTPARFTLARLYLDMARAGRARDELQSALERASDHPQLLMLLGEAERQLGNPKRAIELQRQVLAADPKADQARYYLGFALLDLRQHAAAIQELERVVRSGANPAEGNLGLGTAYLETGRIDEALKVLRESARVDPARPEVHIHLARAYRLKGLLNDAVRELKLAASAMTGSMAALYQNVETHYYLEEGLVRMQQGRLDSAVQSFERVLALDGGHEVARRHLAEARKRLREQAQKKTPGSTR